MTGPRAAGCAAQPGKGGAVGSTQADDDRTGWEFEQGDEIAPGRHAISLLGSGKTCETWMAWDQRLHAAVAIKLLRPSSLGSSRARRRLTREARLLGMLAHPVIPRCYDAALDDPRPHIVEDLVGGRPLSAYLDDGSLGPHQAAVIMLRLAGCLHYLAGEGVVHLDVKPANIMLGAEVRLIDFSHARESDKALVLKVPIGTDRYMAPEQCDPSGEHKPGPASDVWALGACIHHILAGRAPYPRGERGEGDEEDLRARFPQLHRRRRPLPPEVVRSDWRPVADIVRECLARDPAERPTPAEIVVRVETLIAGA